MFFAITLKLNRRNSFDNDVTSLRNAVTQVKSLGTVSLYRFELQPKGLHNLHVHLCLQTEKPISYTWLHNVMKQRDINCDIHQLIADIDVFHWKKYCCKDWGDLAFDYAESTGKEYNKICLFDRQNTAQQMVCEHCGDIKGQKCGTYKCWI